MDKVCSSSKRNNIPDSGNHRVTCDITTAPVPASAKAPPYSVRCQKRKEASSLVCKQLSETKGHWAKPPSPHSRSGSRRETAQTLAGDFALRPSLAT